MGEVAVTTHDLWLAAVAERDELADAASKLRLALAHLEAERDAEREQHAAWISALADEAADLEARLAAARTELCNVELVRDHAVAACDQLARRLEVVLGAAPNVNAGSAP